MAHQEQHDGGTDSRLGTAWSTFTMYLHSILHGRCAFCYFHLAFLERLCDSVRPYGVVNVRPRLDCLSTADSDV